MGRFASFVCLRLNQFPTVLSILIRHWSYHDKTDLTFLTLVLRFATQNLNGSEQKLELEIKLVQIYVRLIFVNWKIFVL